MSGNQIKIIALISMTVDHVGLLIFPHLVILRIIGRLSFPLFAFMIAEGCYFTHNKTRYLGGIAALGLFCQLIYWFMCASLFQSILSTFTLSILLTYALINLTQKRDVAAALLFVTAFLVIFIVCCLLPSLPFFAVRHFSIDYGFFGTILPTLIYIPRLFINPNSGQTNRWAGSHPRSLHTAQLVCTTLGLFMLALSMSAASHNLQWWGLAALACLAVYNGERGAWKMKYLFYIYYPAHLAILYLITQAL